MRAKIGWRLDSELSVYRLPLRITNPETNEWIMKYCLFDTGFSGYLGLDKETISLIHLSETGYGKGLVAKGVIEYKNYEAIVELIDENDAIIEKVYKIDTLEKEDVISIQEFDIPILGIKIIKQFSWLILSDENILYLLK